MPGICGFCGHQDNKLQDMVNAYLVTDFVASKDSFTDDDVSVAQVALTKTNPQKTEIGDVVLFIDGEIYNLDEINEILGTSYKTVPEMLISAYSKNLLQQTLKHIDGYYTAVLYDKANKKISLFTDRLGTRFLYYYLKDGQFAFASETKAILALDDTDKTLDMDSINIFLQSSIGLFPEDKTYFKYIKLIKPSSLITYDIKSQHFSQQYYWKFSDIRQQKISYKKSIDILHTLLVESMRKRLKAKAPKNIGLSLSGGLDSRLCLGLALECGVKPAYVWTMGQKNSLDVHIAHMVCERVGIKHKWFEMTESNWFAPRKTAIWLTDGFFGLVDTHGCEFYDQIANHNLYSLDGYVGDAIIGESFKKNKRLIDKRINERTARVFYGDTTDCLDLSDDYYDTPHLEPHLYMNRVRRYTGVGNTNSRAYFDVVMPFIDNKIVDFIFSIPDAYRHNNKLYEDMLLKYYPNLFKDIPWQRTGRPIIGKIYKNLSGQNKYVYLANFIPFRGLKRHALKRMNSKNPLFTKYSKKFADYQQWLKNPDFIKNMKNILDGDDSVYKRFINRNLWSEFAIPFLDNKTGAFEPSKALTVAIYFKVLCDKNIL